MSPVDIRNENFDSLRASLDERRRSVLCDLAQHGPCTTRQLAERSRRDILSVRPRVTELCQLGLVVLEHCVGREGVYSVRNQRDWELRHDRQMEEQTSGQMQLV